jgi:diamine N-acetyltransferase
MQQLQLLKAREEEIPEITQLATLVWNQYYPAIISRSQIDYMLDLMYSHKSLLEQFNKKHDFYFIVSDAKRVGFISVNREENDNWFINKFYIDQQRAAKGLGTRALQMLISLIKARQLTLTVNRQNIKSINFYFKNGFTIQKIADFDIGNGYVMNDFVMTWRKSRNDDQELRSEI